MWSSGEWFLHHNNAPAHMALSVQQFLAKKQHDGYPSSSLYTWPCAMQLFLFPCMKGQMKGKHFADVSKVKKNTLEVLNISNEEFQKCFQQWEKRWYKHIESKGEYFEGD